MTPPSSSKVGDGTKLATAWVALSIVGLKGPPEFSSQTNGDGSGRGFGSPGSSQQGGSLRRRSQKVPRRIVDVKEATVKLEISTPCGNGAAPRVDESHELNSWVLDTSQSSCMTEDGVDIHFRVLVPIREEDLSDGERVLKVRLDGRPQIEDSGQIKAAQKKMFLGNATLLLSDLLRQKAHYVEAALAPPSTGAKVLAKVWRPPSDARACVRASADFNVPIIEQAYSLRKTPDEESFYPPQRLMQQPAITSSNMRRTVLEACYEPRGTHEVVRGAMQPVADAMLESASAWLRRSEAARCDAALFDNDKEAAQFGARRVRLGLLGARNLARRPRIRSASSSGNLSSSNNGGSPGSSSSNLAGGGASSSNSDATNSSSGNNVNNNNNSRHNYSGNNTTTSHNAVASKTFKTTFNAAAGLVKRIRDGEAPRLGVDDGGDSAAPSAFAVCELRSSKRAFAEALGRTNTEYATEAPAFGANARAAQKCPHSKPQLQFAVSTASVEASKRNPIAKLVSPRDCGDNAGVAPIFEFYARRDECPDFPTSGRAFIKVKVYDERYSLTRGLEPVYLGDCDVPLPPATKAADRPKPIWVPLRTPEVNNQTNPQMQPHLLVWIHAASLDRDDGSEAADESFLKAAREREHRDALDAAAMHAWLPVAGVEVDSAAARLAAADGSALQVSDARDDVKALAGDFADLVESAPYDMEPRLSSSSYDMSLAPRYSDPENNTTNDDDFQAVEDASLRLHDSQWLEVHARALARDGERIAQFASEAQAACALRAPAFKSSMRKADIEVAATPTNLHIQIFADEDDRIWTAATSGAPTPAGPLGSQRGGLLRLEAELSELAASIRKKRVALVSASSASPARRKAAAADLGAAARAWEARAAACAVRKTLARAHALSIAVASVRAHATKVAHTEGDRAPLVARSWVTAGLPVVFQALVSTAGAELAMLEDAAAAVKAIRGTTILFESLISRHSDDDDDSDNQHPSLKDDQNNKDDPLAVSVQRAEGNFVVHLRLPRADIERLGLKPEDRVRIVPVLFCQGLDIKQSMANRRAAFDSSLLGGGHVGSDDHPPNNNATVHATTSARSKGIFSLARKSSSSSKTGAVLPTQSPSHRQKGAILDDDDDDDDAGLEDEGTFGKPPGRFSEDDDDDVVSMATSSIEATAATTASGPMPHADDSASGLQRVLNAEAFDVLYAFAVSAHGEKRAQRILRHLKAAVDKERAAEGKSFEKHWLILVQAELATRALDGGLCVFCKSGKDRTGMSVTLAQSMFFDEPPPSDEKHQHMDENLDLGAMAANDERFTLPRAGILREFGVRLRLCEKNTGRKKYAFNVIQRKFLPAPFQPPMPVIEDLAGSIINRDTS